LLKENDFFAARSAARKKKLGTKNVNETRFFQKKHFVLPLQPIYVVSDQTFHCRRVVMKNFRGEFFFALNKKSNKKWSAHQEELIKI